MKFWAAVICLVAGSHAGLIKHELEHDAKATSYQSIEFEHFHAVPTYVKKEDAQLLKHPIPAGKSSSKVEVHHGGKHDHGYAIASLESDAHLWGGHGHDDGQEQEAIKGHQFIGGRHAAGRAYQVHDQAQDYSQGNEGHSADDGSELQAYYGQGHSGVVYQVAEDHQQYH